MSTLVIKLRLHKNPTIHIDKNLIATIDNGEQVIKIPYEDIINYHYI